MKTLLLMRHASSGWDEMSLSDRARPLDSKGERELLRMARRCSEGVLGPELIVSSPAVRALSTARALAECFGQRADDIRIDDRLYCGSARALLDIVQGLDDRFDHVAIVGHNPEISELGQYLAKGVDRLATCAIASLAFDVSAWSDAPHRKAISSALEVPR